MLNAADRESDQSTLQTPRNEPLAAIPRGKNLQFPAEEDQTFIRIFERQASQTPNNPAFVFKEAEMTYAELNEKANQLAHYLRTLGIREESLVPVCIERSLEMMIGILGIIKAGAAYVPIDPDFPSERIHFILDDTKADVCVSNTKHNWKLDRKNSQVIILDANVPELEVQPKENVPVSIFGSQVCYVIYTSGSTGMPKGVLIEHRSLLNYLLYCKEEYLPEKETKASSFIHLSYTFDASLTAMFVPLLAGKMSVIGSKYGIEAFEDKNFLRYSPYDFLKITPSHLVFLEPLFRKKLEVGKLIIGGEALTRNQLNYLIEEGIDLSVINEYGPTEATVGCTTHAFEPMHCTETLSDNISIGKPIPGAKIYIVDENGLVQDSAPGEIYIGGIGVARSYLNRAETTASKFVTTAFSEGLLYRSGDKGRWLPDGNLEYGGRMDDQVKISGYRLEPGEIEAALRRHPLVKYAVVTTPEDITTKILVAYIVLLHGNSPDENAIASFLKGKLPAYMIPSAYVFVDSFPITANGKIDRKALPAPRGKIIPARQFKEPMNELEKELRSIWQETLGQSPIGVGDNFFDLGGSSLHAALIFAKIRLRTGKDLSLSSLFSANTIEKLALLINGEQQSGMKACLVPIQPMGSKTPLFCMHAGAGSVLLYHHLSACLGADQPLYGLQARGLNGGQAPHTSIEDMARHYISEIRKIQPEGPYNLAGYCLGGILAFEMAKQLLADGKDIGLLATMNGVSPLYPSPMEDIEHEEHLLRNFIKSFSTNLNHFIKGFRNLSGKQKGILLVKMLLKPLLGKKTRQRLRKALYRLYITNNRPLPLYLRELYFLETNVDMVKAYKPDVYNGDMVILRSPGIYPEPGLGWESLVKGRIVTLDVPGEHKNRREIMNEPYVRETAELLSKFLDH